MKYFDYYKPHKLLGPFLLMRGMSHIPLVHQGQFSGSSFWITDARKSSRKSRWVAAGCCSYFKNFFGLLTFCKLQNREEVREQLGCHMYFFFLITPVLFILRSTTVVITSSYRARSLWGRLKHPAGSHFHDSYPSRELPASVNGCVMQVLPSELVTLGSVEGQQREVGISAYFTSDYWELEEFYQGYKGSKDC